MGLLMRPGTAAAAPIRIVDEFPAVVIYWDVDLMRRYAQQSQHLQSDSFQSAAPVVPAEK